MTAMLKKTALFLLLLVPVFADQKKDDEIYDKVKLRLAGDPEVKGGALEVDVKRHHQGNCAHRQSQNEGR